jgi:hypothetical protein
MRAGEFIPKGEPDILIRMRDLIKRIQTIKNPELKDKLLQLTASVRTMSDIDMIDSALYKFGVKELNEHEMVWSRAKTTTRGGKAKLKWRCTSGKRKGRIVPSVSDCDKPINVAKRATMKRTRAQTYKQQARRSERSKRINTASRLIRALNKARKT